MDFTATMLSITTHRWRRFRFKRTAGSARLSTSTIIRVRHRAHIRLLGRTLVTELGLDRVYVSHVDAAKTAITAADPPFVSVSAGSGPRRLALSPNEKFLYVNHETDSKVSVFAIDRGTLKETQQISTLPADFTGRNSTAEIQLDEAGRFLYVSNRGANSIAVYAVDAGKGTLTLQGFVAALGQSPRNITIDPTGRYFFAANQSSNNVVIFSIDAKSGQLAPTGQQLQMDQPASVFLVKSGITSETGQVK
jgi:6-phosphogluconolactonase